jgi:hypothetical protein
MDEDDQLQAIADAADGAIRAQGWMPTGVLVLATVLTEDGRRDVCIAPSRDIRAIESLGLLRYAILREEAGITREVLGDG